MNQLTFSDIEYSNRKKKTKREEFLDAMEEIIPWSYWVEMIRPFNFANKRGRKPIGIETMLRMYLMQIWFNLSDEGIQDSDSMTVTLCVLLCISISMNNTCRPQLPCLSSDICLRQTKLGEKIFADVNNRLDKEVMMHGDTIVDASLIAVPKSAKNQDGRRDPGNAPGKEGQ